MYIIKYLIDYILALIILIILSPIFVIIAIAIKLDSKGPIFFLQERVGRDSVIFKIFKFRSMIDQPGSILTSGNSDKRITRVGYFIRKFHLDEFIQVLNVLKGDMSLVGPRPESPIFINHYKKQWDKILVIKPGITGLACIKFAYSEYKILARSTDPYNTYVNEILPIKIKYELFYVKNRSLRMDFAIICSTLLTFFKKS